MQIRFRLKDTRIKVLQVAILKSTSFRNAFTSPAPGKKLTLIEFRSQGTLHSSEAESVYQEWSSWDLNPQLQDGESSALTNCAIDEMFRGIRKEAQDCEIWGLNYSFYKEISLFSIESLLTSKAGIAMVHSNLCLVGTSSARYRVFSPLQTEVSFITATTVPCLYTVVTPPSGGVSCTVATVR